MSAPLTFDWDGETFRPQPRFRKAADKQYVVGMSYPLVVHEERSRASHNQFFAALHEYFLNLPELIAEQFPTEDHLRKYCLIKAGFCDSRTLVCGSKAGAQRVAAFIKPMDEYAIITVKLATVFVFTAQSQSLRAMGKKDFQASKQAVLEICEALVGAPIDPTVVRDRSPSLAPDADDLDRVQRERVT